MYYRNISWDDIFAIVQGDHGQSLAGEEWVEWSATGLKDASVFDLSPTGGATEDTRQACTMWGPTVIP